jgi:hypothetical protein
MISCKNSKNSKKTAKSAGSRRGCFGYAAAGRAVIST